MAMGVERNSVIQGSYATPRDSVKLEGGLFGTDSVRTETVAPKSEKLREALASVKLFFQSLFGMKVSTADTEPTDRTSGTKHLMSAMTKANPKLDDILLASAKLVDVGGFNTDALATHNRLDEGAAEEFKSQLKDMTDSQLKRLASTFDKLPDLSSGLEHAGIDASKDETFDVHETTDQAIENLVNIDVVLKELKTALRSEFAERGFKRPDLGEKGATGPEPSDDLKSLVKYVVKEGGVTEKAIERNFTHDYDPERMKEIEKDKVFTAAIEKVY